jgi:uncharacterized protein (TIGR02302 family)
VRTGSERTSESDDGPAGLDRRIAAAIRRARFVALVERAWPWVVAVAAVPLIFVAAAWLGLFALFAAPIRLLVAIPFGLAAIVAVGVAVAALRRQRAAFSRSAAIARIERASDLGSRELSTFLDRPASVDDPATLALWRAHRARSIRRIGRLGVGPARPDLGRRDRWALRPLLAMLLFVAWFAAGDERFDRIAAVFAAGPDAAAPADRLDVWVDPPSHTGRPPVNLAVADRTPMVGSAPIVVPAGSRLVARVAAARADEVPPTLDVALARGDGSVDAAAGADEERRTGVRERDLAITADGVVTVRVGGRDRLRVALSVMPDRPPTIRLVGEPRSTPGGSLDLAYEVDDDWGVVAAEALSSRSPSGLERPLYRAPSFALSLPAGGRRAGRAATRRDLTAHPFAGATVRMRLVARDAIGQEGSSEPFEVVLPERRFLDPTARALIDLRRRLALDARSATSVAAALEALTVRPERFDVRADVHLGLRFAVRRTLAAKTDDELREVVDLMWTMATTIDAGRAAATEQALAAAEEALREALARGASDEEITRLTKELREALGRHLEALSAEARQNPGRRTAARGARRVEARDLAGMLDRIEQLARTGARGAAEQLLSELRDMTLGLRAGQGEAGGGAGADPTEAIGEVIRRQQRLMDETHRAGREGGGDREALRRAQQGLRDALRGLGGGGDDLDAAGEAMDDATEALGRDSTEEAVDAQGRAIDGLRSAARRIDGRSRAGDDGEVDPAGRRRRDGLDRGDGVRVPGEIETERARRILEDIRRRLAEPERPRPEHDYLDRLQRFD